MGYKVMLANVGVADHEDDACAKILVIDPASRLHIDEAMARTIHQQLTQSLEMIDRAKAALETENAVS